MSIALSVLSGPSEAGAALMAVASTTFIGVGAVSLMQFFWETTPFSAVFFAPCIMIAGTMLAIFSWGVLRRQSGKVRLSISARGQMRVMSEAQHRIPVADGADIVQMMPGSTLWPFFILLRLRQQNKKMIVVSFFWGSLSFWQFRRLSIACRWIAMRNDVGPSPSRAGRF